jgi:hypothetical protein
VSERKGELRDGSRMSVIVRWGCPECHADYDTPRICSGTHAELNVHLPRSTERIKYVPAEQLRGAVSEFVAYLRACGPASDPAEWHRLMAKHDPEYPESDVGRAYRALGGQS